MPYADKEKRRAVSRAHYAENKYAYNPSREKRRAFSRRLLNELLELFIAQSKDRWVSPQEITNQTILFAKKGITSEIERQAFLKRVALHLDGGRYHSDCGTVLEVGMLNGKRTFSKSCYSPENYMYQGFASALKNRKTKFRPGQVELLILKQTLLWSI